MAYTSIALTPHTDNPYRKPIPCIQLLHCLENEVKGGLSTLVDGFAVSEYLRKNHKDLFKILTETKVRFRFIDKTIILENWGELIELNENNHHQLFIPSGFAHGFLTLDKENIIFYGCDNYRSAHHEVTINWDDPSVKINWPSKKKIISNKDKSGISFKEFVKKI